MTHCPECGGKLNPDKELWKDTIPEMKKLLGDRYEEPTGYTCFDDRKGCGATYDKDFKRKKMNLGWLKK